MRERANGKLAWEANPLFATDPTLLVSENGEPIQLDPNHQYWFIRRSYGIDAAESLSLEAMNAVFANLPVIVRSPGFKARKDFDKEFWLQGTYLWLQGHKQSEIAKANGTKLHLISRGIKNFGRIIAKQRSLAQLISGELPPEPPTKTPRMKKIGRPAGAVALNGKNNSARGKTDSSGEVDLKDSSKEVTVKIDKGSMTSADFWRSPIRPPRRTIGRKHYLISKEKPQPFKIESVITEEREGRVFKKLILEGYAGPAPLQDKERPIDYGSLNVE